MAEIYHIQQKSNCSQLTTRVRQFNHMANPSRLHSMNKVITQLVMLRLSNRRSKSNSFLKIKLNRNRFFGWYFFDFDSRLYWRRQRTAASRGMLNTRPNYMNRMPRQPRGTAATIDVV